MTQFNSYSWNGIRFCIKRIDIDSIEFSDRCQKGFKKCGKDVCVRMDQLCPLTDIKIEDNNLSESIVSSIPLRDSYLKLYRDPLKNPIISLEVSYDRNPCYLPNRRPASSKVFPFIKAQYGCESYGQDMTSIVLDEQKEEDLYVSNHLSEMLDTIPQYRSALQNQMVYLIYRKKLLSNLNSACEEHINAIRTSYPILSGIFASQNDMSLYLIIDAVSLGTLVFYIVCCATQDYTNRRSKQETTLFLIVIFTTVSIIMGSLSSFDFLKKISNISKQTMVFTSSDLLECFFDSA